VLPTISGLPAVLRYDPDDPQEMRIIVHYHEIGLKGKNSPFFRDRLVRNLKRAMADLGTIQVNVLSSRLLLQVDDAVDFEAVRGRVETVFGVANFCRALEFAPDLSLVKEAAVAMLRDRRVSSFRVKTKRSYKGFPHNSGEVDRVVGAAIHETLGVKVDLDHPEVTVFVEILRDRILLASERLPGPGGFPVGSSGKVLGLLSGGIDSPVAAYRMMKRGCTVLLVHFHAFPIVDHTTIDKAKELARVLTRYQFRTELLLVAFGKVQQTIVASCPAHLRVVLYRRFMARIAEVWAARRGAKALVTGESLGQVASQTLDNLRVIDAVAKGPILRPLVSMDKQEIVAEAQKIGTFPVSILPDQDCCQLFVPKSPATAANIAEVEKAEQALDIPSLLRTAIQETESEIYFFPLPPEGSGA
jgi:thiamine biosynthesis protein ThiI